MTDEDMAPAAPPADWAAQLLTFWFDHHGRDDWFGGGDGFDAACQGFAGEWLQALRRFPADHFLTDPETALAAIILFDQMPRNLFRGHADAFATDALALAIARAFAARGWDAQLAEDRRLFAYLPFEHSEDMDDQRESLRLFAALGNAEYLGFAKAHFDIIDRFGRFPHRNAALGRAMRPDEASAVEEGSNW